MPEPNFIENNCKTLAAQVNEATREGAAGITKPAELPPGERKGAEHPCIVCGTPDGGQMFRIAGDGGTIFVVCERCCAEMCDCVKAALARACQAGIRAQYDLSQRIIDLRDLQLAARDRTIGDFMGKLESSKETTTACADTIEKLKLHRDRYRNWALGSVPVIGALLWIAFTRWLFSY